MNNLAVSIMQFYRLPIPKELLGNARAGLYQVKSLYQLLYWKRNYLLFPKPTLSTDQIFVFWVHSSVVDSALLLTGVQGGFKVAQIHSKMGLSAVEKEEIVSDFQAGKYDVIIGGIKIMGVGLTLTKSSHVVFNDFAWTPADLLQAEDRIHRIGQLVACNIYYMKASEEFDDMLWSLLMNKFEDGFISFISQRMAATVGGEALGANVKNLMFHSFSNNGVE